MFFLDRDENVYKCTSNVRVTRISPGCLLTMEDSVKTCGGFAPNPAIFGLGVSRYLSNRTSGIYWSSVVTDILLLYSSPRCSGACQVDFSEMADLWNWTRKPGSPANTGDLERRYSPGCQWVGLAYYSCYPNCRGESHSLPCISGHKLALSAEHIVSILSIQSYVLCSYFIRAWQVVLLSEPCCPSLLLDITGNLHPLCGFEFKDVHFSAWMQ